MVVGSARRLTAADIRARWAQNISCGQGSALDDCGRLPDAHRPLKRAAALASRNIEPRWLNSRFAESKQCLLAHLDDRCDACDGCLGI